MKFMVVVYRVCMWLQMVDIRLIPKTECLKDTVARVLPYWYDVIVPEIKVEIVTRVILCIVVSVWVLTLKGLFDYRIRIRIHNEFEP